MIKFDPQHCGPLAVVHVLDLSRLVAGNMLSLYLADFGADVIKVERKEGDDLRRWREGATRSTGRSTGAASVRWCWT